MSTWLASPPIDFEPNHGQYPGGALFTAKIGNGRVEFFADRIVFPPAAGSDPKQNVELRFEGGAFAPRLEGVARRQWHFNYYVAAGSFEQVPSFEKLRYHGVYPGIDIVFYGRGTELEYDFVVAPGADPDQIRGRFRGGAVALDAQGNLVVRAGSRQLVQKTPHAFQWIGGRERKVASRYQLDGDGRFALALGRYDRARELVIDPILSVFWYSNVKSSVVSDIAVSGNRVVAAGTWLGDPATAGGFVLSWNGSSATPDWISIIGYSVQAVALDSLGRVHVTGYVFPSVEPATQPLTIGSYTGSTHAGGVDAFVASLKSDGTRVLYSYLGGSSDDIGEDIRTNGETVIVVGQTFSSNFPRQTGSPNSAGTGFRVSYRLGTPANPSQMDPLDASSITAALGNFGSQMLPFQGGELHARGNKVTFLGAGPWQTTLPGTGSTIIQDMAVDRNNNIWVVGDIVAFPGEPINGLATQGAIQTQPNGGVEAFVAKLDSGGVLRFASYLGGPGDDRAEAVAVDGQNDVLIAGRFGGVGFPTAPGARRTNFGGLRDAFILKIAGNTEKLAYSYFFGGTGWEEVDSLAMTGDDLVFAGYLQEGGGPAAADVATSAGTPDDTGVTQVFVGRMAKADIRTTVISNSALAVDPNAAVNMSLRLTNSSYQTLDNLTAGSATRNLGLTGTFPSKLTLTSCDFNGVNCLVNGQFQPSMIQNVPLGGQWTLNIAGQVSNTAQPGEALPVVIRGLADSDDPNFTNNELTVNFRVRRPVDVRTTLDGAAATLQASFEGGAPKATPFIELVDPAGTFLVSAPTPQSLGPDTRARFVNWIDGPNSYNTAAVTVPSRANQVVQANFVTQFRATATANDGSRGTVAITPTDAGGFWDRNTRITVTATPAAGFRLQNFSISGAGAGQFDTNPYSFDLTGPSTIVANFVCAVTLNPTQANVSAAAATGQTISVTAGNDCSWTVQSVPSWITITSGGSGTGNGTITYSVQANPTSNPRSATLAIGGVSFTVNQAGACLFTLTPNSRNVTAAAGTGSFTVTAPAGCNWTAVSNHAWLTVTGGASGSGNGTVNYSYQGNLGAQRTGTITAGGQTFTLNQAAPAVGPQVSQAVAVSPAEGSGYNQIFTFTFSDPQGFQDLDVMNIVINSALDGRNACFLAYVRTTNTWFLVNDAGTGLLPGVTPGQTGGALNSQCSINGIGSSVNGSGNLLTLVLNLNFNIGFRGRKLIYLAARDVSENNSGWQPMGVWTVPGQVPTTTTAVNSLTPARGSGGIGTSQLFTFSVSDSRGFPNIGVVNVVVNTALDGRNACYIAYVRSTNTIFLVNDVGDALLPGIVAGGTGSVSNSQCTIDAAGSSAGGAGPNLTLQLRITFKPSFTGNMIIYAAARDTQEQNNTGWQPMGTWTVQ